MSTYRDDPSPRGAYRVPGWDRRIEGIGVVDERTFGVVVLQGSGQVRLIEDLLQPRVAPEEWETRRLRVGTPPAFQGDERDVVFLSMVVADRRRAVTARGSGASTWPPAAAETRCGCSTR
jgi:hypothetical protein